MEAGLSNNPIAIQSPSSKQTALIEQPAWFVFIFSIFHLSIMKGKCEICENIQKAGCKSNGRKVKLQQIAIKVS
jgi:hypothetical protein